MESFVPRATISGVVVDLDSIEVNGTITRVSDRVIVGHGGRAEG
jgi:hypothetical protein